jgi:C-22 sterol desaturase
MMPMRDLNMEVSLRVFCGQHISPEDERAIGEKYWLITRALELVNFPLALPGTNVHAAIGARKIAMAILMDVAAKSKLSMAAGDEPTCLVDAWIKSMIDARTDGGDDDEETRKVLVREFSDHEIAMVVLSFLFASQDAMSSSICHAFELLADHPEILAKVREEQLRVRGGDVDKPMSFELLDQMTYTRATIKESLRVLPPVIMVGSLALALSRVRWADACFPPQVPYMTLKDFPINPEYTVPKGTMLIPSIWPSLHDADVYPEPDSFIPERWLGSDGKTIEDPNPKNYMVFGAGAHKVRPRPCSLPHLPHPSRLNPRVHASPVHRLRVRLLVHDRRRRPRGHHDGL